MLPVLFRLQTPFGELTIHAFGLSLTISILLGWYLIIKHEQERQNNVGVLYLLTILSATVGARIVWLALHYKTIDSVSDVFAIHRGGLSAWGAIIFVCMFSISARHFGLMPRRWLDLLTLPAMCSVGLNRLGYYLEGCENANAVIIEALLAIGVSAYLAWFEKKKPKEGLQVLIGLTSYTAIQLFLFIVMD